MTPVIEALSLAEEMDEEVVLMPDSNTFAGSGTGGGNYCSDIC